MALRSSLEHSNFPTLSCVHELSCNRHHLIVIEPSKFIHMYDGYYVAYKLITLSCILFIFIEIKFIHCHSCVMFAMKSMSMRND